MQGQMTIFDYMTPAEQWKFNTGLNDYWQTDIKFVDDKPVCKYSNHSCNRTELFKIAESLDDIECPKICCRKCDVVCCGARCNGSEEPQRKTLKVDVRGLLDDGYCPECNICLDDLVPECPICHSFLDWTSWKILNE